VARFDRSARHSVCIGDSLQRLLTLGASVEMALQGEAEHLAAVETDMLFKLGV
jgi:hypothetical protein